MNDFIEHPVTRAGIWRRQNAAEHRALAGHLKEKTVEESHREADDLDADADVLLDSATLGVPTAAGTGGELDIDRDAIRSPLLIDTLNARPDMVAVDASRHRLALIENSGGTALALDTAASTQAANSLEKMLSHQIAVAHMGAMELHAEGMALLRDFQKGDRRSSYLTAEAMRLMNAATRMMEATQRGVMTLHRLRTAGRQTLIVQHVHVGEGGQAVVTGEVTGRDQGKGRAPGG